MGFNSAFKGLTLYHWRSPQPYNFLSAAITVFTQI